MIRSLFTACVVLRANMTTSSTAPAFGRLVLQPRSGDLPTISGPIPQSQRSQNGPVNYAHELIRRGSKLDGVEIAFTYIGDSSPTIPGAFRLKAGLDTSRCLIKNEIGHIHVDGDNAGHFIFSPEDHKAILAARWGITHPLAGQKFGKPGSEITVPHTNTLIFSPRDPEELETFWTLLQRSYYYVSGKLKDDEL